MSHEPSVVEVAFTSVMLELGRLRRADLALPELRRQVHDVDLSLTRLCDAIEDPRNEDTEVGVLARRAFLAVLALGQMLEGTDSDELRTRETLEITRSVIADLLDTLEPYVGHADRAMRDVLLHGEPLDAALQRLFCA